MSEEESDDIPVVLPPKPAYPPDYKFFGKPSFAVKLMLTSLVCSVSACSFILLYFLVWEKPDLYYPNLPFPAIKDAYPGEAVQLKVMRCNRGDLPRSYVITRQISCRTLNPATGQYETQPPVLLPSTTVPVAPGCLPVTSAVNVVPDSIPVGSICQVDGTAEIEGHIITHFVPWHSAEFNVIAKPLENGEK